MRISLTSLLSFVALASCLSCSTAPQIERHGQYMWVPGFTGMHTTTESLQKEYNAAHSSDNLGGPPVALGWTGEGIAFQSAVTSAINASRGGGCGYRGGRGR